LQGITSIFFSPPLDKTWAEPDHEGWPFLVDYTGMASSLLAKKRVLGRINRHPFRENAETSGGGRGQEVTGEKA